MSERVIPLNGRILIKIKDLKKVTEGGLIIPESPQSKENRTERAFLVKTSNDSDSVIVDGVKISVGDEVIFDRHAGVKLKFEDVDGDYLLLSIRDIFAKIEK
jgi:chaperonin GroES